MSFGAIVGRSGPTTLSASPDGDKALTLELDEKYKAVHDDTSRRES